MLFSGTFNIYKLYFVRFMRLAPALAAVIALTVSFGYFFDQKAPYLIFKSWIEPCERHWLSSLLFVQNFVNIDDMVNLS